jgi:hypothetical protein
MAEKILLSPITSLNDLTVTVSTEDTSHRLALPTTDHSATPVLGCLIQSLPIFRGLLCRLVLGRTV